MEGNPGGLDGLAVGKGGQGAGGRSEESFATRRETAKPLSPIDLSPPSSPDFSSPVDPLTQSSQKIPQSELPVLGVSGGVQCNVGPQVVQTYHVGGLHSGNRPVLTQGDVPAEENVGEVPFAVGVDAPQSTAVVKAGSPFVTGNDRIDRRTAFTQWCKLGEGRTYMDVAKIMALSEDIIREWASQDGWENAYRERITADIVQISREENIHEYLDVKREMIAQLKAKIVEAKGGKDVFKSPKEMLDTMLRLEELTGAKGMDERAKPKQIFVIISEEDWRAREELNEKIRKEEANHK